MIDPEKMNNDDLLHEMNKIRNYFYDIDDYIKCNLVEQFINRFSDYRDLIDETHALLDTISIYEKNSNSNYYDEKYFDWVDDPESQDESEEDESES